MRPSSLVPAALLAFAAQPRTTAAAPDPRGAPCFEACQMTLRPISFTGADGGVARLKYCRNPLGVASLYLCARAYCTPENRIEGLDFENKTCQAKYKTALPPWDFIANYTDEDVARVWKFEKEQYEPGATFAEAAIPSEHLFMLAYDTLWSWSYVFTGHIRYGIAMFVFWAVVVAIGLGGRFVEALSQPVATKRRGWQQIPLEELEDGHETASKDTKRAFRLTAWLRRHLIVPATFGYRAAQPFGWYTVPPRVQTLTLFAFVVLNVVLCAQRYRVFPDNLYFPEVYTQAWRYLSDRTGIISLANFPLIWLFGMRNNFLMWVTGWDFGTYNNFHRWVARVATLEAVVHSIGYTFLVFDRGGWPLFINYWKQTWWTTGEIATVVMCALMPLSLYWMRRHVYELFLLLHIVLSIVLLLTMWAHVNVFGEYGLLTQICGGIWLLDRVLRMLRTLAFNRWFWTTRAQAMYDPTSNMIRLSIPCGKSLYRPRPGTFYYIHLLNDGRFWESHPFTMAKLEETKAFDAVVPQDTDSLVAGDELSSLTPRTDPSGGRSELAMTFLIRPYDSFTKRLRDAAHRAYPQPTYLPMIAEGPYGRTHSFHHFDHILFVVGGSGIVVPLVYIESLLKPTAATKVVSIVWAVREPSLATSVLLEDFAPYQDAFASGKLNIDVYVTRAEAARELHDVPKEARILHGRPDVPSEVEDAVREYGRQGDLAVVACGPARMNDDARKAVVDCLGNGKFSIEYFEESFNW
ncbi:ferric reductase like transmembrane component [Thozetella sp. PMI_491]|nr:ferric reductase like transmembrane component [Thozetella sp. PMI_491]